MGLENSICRIVLAYSGPRPLPVTWLGPVQLF